MLIILSGLSAVLAVTVLVQQHRLAEQRRHAALLRALMLSSFRSSLRLVREVQRLERDK